MRDGDQQKWSNTSLFAPAPLVLAFVAPMAVVSLGAQTLTTGDIAGTVTDPTGAVVSGVPVTSSITRTLPSPTQMRPAASSDKSLKR
jgi:hypothetical protein